MIPFSQRWLRARVTIEGVIQRAWKGTGRLFFSQAEMTRRNRGRFEALKRLEMETERLDRLRNPRDYEGK